MKRSSLALLVMGLSLCRAPGASGQSDASPGVAPVGGAIRDLAPNTWVNANPKHMLPAIKQAQWLRTDGYSGSAFRSKTGTILFRSGIQSDADGLNPGFYSNALLEWDLASNRVEVLDVSRWGGGAHGGGKLPPDYEHHPVPTPRHTYDGMAYVESEDALYLVLGANWRVGKQAEPGVKEVIDKDNNSTWRFDLSSRTWKRIEDGVRRLWPSRTRSPYENHLRWWPDGGKLLFLDSRGSLYAEFDLKASKWEQAVLANAAPMSLYNARSAWDSKRGLWVFRLGHKACTFDPGTRQYQALPDLPDLVETEEHDKGGSKGIVYIPRHDVYLANGRTSRDTRVFDLAAGKWIAVAGGDEALPNGYPQYDPRTDLVGLVKQDQAFVFRYQPKNASVNMEKNEHTVAVQILAYKRVGDVTLNLHVLRKRGLAADVAQPGVVFFVCGGWTGFNVAKMYPQSEYLALRGMTVAIAEVRVKPKHGTTPAECVIDARSAVRWVRANAQRLGIAPQRIAAGGGSAGAHVAACTAMVEGYNDPSDPPDVSCRPDALVLFNPALDILSTPKRIALFGGEEKARALSPAEHVRPGLPPSILLHGRADTTVDVGEVEKFGERMQQAGNRCVLKLYDGEGHGFFNYYNGKNPMFKETLRATDRFFVDIGWIEGPDRLDSFVPTLLPTSAKEPDL